MVLKKQGAVTVSRSRGRRKTDALRGWRAPRGLSRIASLIFRNFAAGSCGAPRIGRMLQGFAPAGESGGGAGFPARASAPDMGSSFP
ncbi:hypothetical protein GCM10007036_31480 [Alsobacter metallidurans]|uniref:Uncharacterized protein n=1 Tax=Alsobacter metallidurans TaxID=340221 RepID=A0A917I8Z4_9HYPH|nr:hypothetical protein GCM10007036_31480 [Alsobacter metallidurans]